MQRLSTILSLIDPTVVFADIGCDHGKLCKMVADNGLAEKIIAADISEPSLTKAKELLKDYGNVEFYVSDGFSQLPKEIDVSVISGMGGREILNIISKKRIKTLILQPQNHIGAVRRFLCETGYTIVADKLVKENGKYYFVLKAVYDIIEQADSKTVNDTHGKAVCETVNDTHGQAVCETVNDMNGQAVCDMDNDSNIQATALVPTAVQEAYGMFYTQKSKLLKELLEKDEKKYLSFKATKENTQRLKIIREALLCQQ